MNVMAHFDERLAMLGHLLSKARESCEHESRDLGSILAARIAPDMFPFPHQIVFACNQANALAAWIAGEPEEAVDPAQLSFEDLVAHVDKTRARLAEAAGLRDDAALDREKTIALPQGRIRLSGVEYLESWLMPNFYFHLVAAYALLRQSGVDIGKADYMIHMVPRLEPHAGEAG
jgi:hypothetical protein